MIDLHFHILPGIDDGPETIEESVAIARDAAAAGTRILVATPHVSWRYPNDASTIARLVNELRARLRTEGIRLDLRRGAEIALTHLPEIEPAELSGLGLGGGPWLLIEPPFSAVATGLDIFVEDLRRRGHRILLAHPERCPAFQREPSILEALVKAGVITSITAGSLVGRFGGHVQRFALRLARDGLIHNVASDAHDITNRAPGMADEIEQAGLGPLTQWLTEEVPAAILRGQDMIPPRPTVALPGIDPPGHRWWHGVRRSRKLRDRDNHADQHEHDDRDLHPDPRRRHGEEG